MNKSLPRTFLAAVLAALAGNGWCSFPPAKAAPHTPSAARAWAPDAALNATLGPEALVAGYRMRLPRGYVADLKKEQANAAFRTKLLSLHRADGAGPSLFVLALSFPPAEKPGTPEQIMAGDGYIHVKANLVKTRPETGRINGLTSVRQYFQFTGVDGHKKHGFHYVIADGAKRTMIVAVDDEPYSKASLPLAEASVLTLRK